MSQMRIVIDGNEANIVQRVGSNVYAFEIIKHLELLTRENDSVTWTVLLAAPPVTDMPRPRQGWQYKVLKPAPMWTQIAAPIYLFFHSDNYDVYFTPGHYAPRLSAVPYVSSVMDLAFLHFPHQFKKNDLLQLKNWTKYSVKHAKKVIAISQTTKQDVIKKYRKSVKDVVVVYPALPTSFGAVAKKADSSILKKYDLKQPYILYVGTLQPRKNLERLIEAFEMVSRQIESNRLPSVIKNRLGGKEKRERKINHLQLVIAGKVGWLADSLLKRIEISPFTDNIKVIGYVSDEEKNTLFRLAETSILIGLYEGFGMPPLESIANQTIPIVSNTSSLPEVVGTGGILVDPLNVSSIAQGIQQVLHLSTKDKLRYQRRMKQQLSRFSWTQSAQIILDTLHQVAKK